MSLKPPKKSDLDKQWMQSRHRCEVQIQPEFHLIVTEGTQTEPMYFEAIRQEINQHYRDRIQLEIHGEGDNTLSLLERAKSRVRNSGLIYKHVWIVYDTDDFPAERINQTETDCNVLSKANGETSKIENEKLTINGASSEYKKIYESLDISGKFDNYNSYHHETAEIDFSNFSIGDSGSIRFYFHWVYDEENPYNPSSNISGMSRIVGYYVGEKGVVIGAGS